MKYAAYDIKKILNKTVQYHMTTGGLLCGINKE